MAATLNGVAFPLTHLFEAHFVDGSSLQQTAEDRSRLDHTRSAFYDVVQRQAELAFFGLYDPTGHTYVVDLRDGHFEIDGVPFSAQPVSSNCIPAGGTFRLLYFRDHQQDFLQGGNGERSAGEHRLAYRLGWEYTHGSKSWTQTIVVN